MKVHRAFLLTTILTAGCTTLTLAPVGERRTEMLMPIELALTQDLARLTRAAEGGDPVSQYAMSIVLQHGLHRTPIDVDQARQWRGRALSAQASRPIGTYIASANGGAGRTVVSQQSGPTIIYYQTLVVDGCVDYLNGSRADTKWCGSTTQAEELKSRWSDAMPH